MAELSAMLRWWHQVGRGAPGAAAGIRTPAGPAAELVRGSTAIVQNTEATPHEAGEVLEICGIDSQLTGLMGGGELVLKVRVPTDPGTAPFADVCVLAGPLEGNGHGEAIVSGLARVTVVVVDADHLFAVPQAGDALAMTTAADGGYPIVYRTGGEAIVRIGRTPAAAGGVIRGTVQDVTGNTVSVKQLDDTGAEIGDAFNVDAFGSAAGWPLVLSIAIGATVLIACGDGGERTIIGATPFLTTDPDVPGILVIDGNKYLRTNAAPAGPAIFCRSVLDAGVPFVWLESAGAGDASKVVQIGADGEFKLDYLRGHE